VSRRFFAYRPYNLAGNSQKKQVLVFWQRIKIYRYAPPPGPWADPPEKGRKTNLETASFNRIRKKKKKKKNSKKKKNKKKKKKKQKKKKKKKKIKK